MKTKKVKTRKVPSKDSSKLKPKNNLLPKIVLVAAILAVLIFIGFYYRSALVGKATGTPTPEPVNLDTVKSDEFDFSKLKSQDYLFTFSQNREKAAPQMVTLAADEIEEGIISYKISGKFGEAFGLLGKEVFSTGPLYLDADDQPDAELSLLETVLAIKNLNFISPDKSVMTAFDSNFKKVDGNILYAGFNQSVIYYINITSSSKPNLTAVFWESTGTPAEYSENASGSKFVTLMFNQTFEIVRPEILTIVVEVAGEITGKQFIFAVDGMVYQLDQIHYPKINLSQSLAGKFSLTYSFDPIKSGEKDLQPFALLCGSRDLKTTFAGKDNIKTIFSYENDIQQWKEGIPSEFSSLAKDKGYLLRLKPDTSLSLTLNCDTKPVSNLPVLDKTWNLVGISGYEPVSYDELMKKVPKGKKKVTFYDFSLLGAEILESIDQFEPGKVYWVKVE